MIIDLKNNIRKKNRTKKIFLNPSIFRTIKNNKSFNDIFIIKVI